MPAPSGNDQLFVEPKIPTVEGNAAPGRMLAVSCWAGQPVTIRWVMRNPEGNPVDFSDISTPTVKARIRESLVIRSDIPFTEITGIVVDATAGRVDIPLTKEAIIAPGISKCDVAVLDSNDNIVFSNQFWIIVNRNSWDLEEGVKGPPTLAEIRLHLRDSCPEDNLWLAVEEFDPAEIAACIERPVQYWNEALPPIDVYYNTANFPYRFNWLNGIIAGLYTIAARWYLRVHLPYNAGGIAVDDKNKFKEYAMLGQKLWAEYAEWVIKKKAQFNAEAAVRSTLSPYSYYFRI